MGCYSVYCQASKISIVGGEEVVLFILAQDKYSSYRVYQTEDYYLPIVLPIFGTYDEYGCIQDIKKNANTKLIEEHYGINIQEFCNYVTRISWDDAPKNLQDLRPCWMLKEVYDLLIEKTNTWSGKHLEKGHKENRLSGRLVPMLHISEYAWIVNQFKHETHSRLKKKLKVWDNKRPITKAIFDCLVAEEEIANKNQFFFNGLMHLWRLILNMQTFSCIFEPIIEPLAPQCGKHDVHLKFVKKFEKILKDRIKEQEK